MIKRVPDNPHLTEFRSYHLTYNSTKWRFSLADFSTSFLFVDMLYYLITKQINECIIKFWQSLDLWKISCEFSSTCKGLAYVDHVFSEGNISSRKSNVLRLYQVFVKVNVFEVVQPILVNTILGRNLFKFSTNVHLDWRIDWFWLLVDKSHLEPYKHIFGQNWRIHMPIVDNRTSPISKLTFMGLN